MGEFLSDREKLEYYAQISKTDIEKYFFETELKIYEGAELLIYHYTDEGLVIFDTVLMCTDFSVSHKGLRVTLIDKKSFRIHKIGDIPNHISRMDIICHAPYTCAIERTVKTTGTGRTMQGVTMSLCFRTKSPPALRSPEHLQVIHLSTASKFFGIKTFELAAARLEAGLYE